MPKVVSRNVTAIAPDEVEESDPVSSSRSLSKPHHPLTYLNLVSQSKKLHLLYCLCGEFQLVLPGPLTALPIRPLDGARALRNSGPQKKTYKLTAQPRGDKGAGVLVRRGEAFEYQRKSPGQSTVERARVEKVAGLTSDLGR